MSNVLQTVVETTSMEAPKEQILVSNPPQRAEMEPVRTSSYFD